MRNSLVLIDTSNSPARNIRGGLTNIGVSNFLNEQFLVIGKWLKKSQVR